MRADAWSIAAKQTKQEAHESNAATTTLIGYFAKRSSLNIKQAHWSAVDAANQYHPTSHSTSGMTTTTAACTAGPNTNDATEQPGVDNPANN